MPSAFDTEFATVALPELKETFGQECRYTPRIQDVRYQSSFTVTAIFDESQSLTMEGNEAASVETRRMDVLIAREDLKWTVRHGDEIRRTVGAGTHQFFRVVSDVAESSTEWDDSGSAMLRIQVVQIRNPDDVK